MVKKIYITNLFWIISGLSIFIQSSIGQTLNETGYPLIQNFSSEDHFASNQAFDIVQGPDGIIYVANRMHVLAYDGHSWEQVFEYRMRSLDISPENEIFVGLFQNLGVLIKDSVNQFSFFSLLETIPEENRDFQSIEKVIVTEESVFFSGGKYIFQWIPEKENKSQTPKGEMKIFENENVFDPVHYVDGQIYARVRGLGLTQFNGEDFKLIAGGDRLADSGVRAVLPFRSRDSDTQLIIATIRHGLFAFNGKTIEPYTPGPRTNEMLANHLIYSGKTLSNGDWVFNLMPGNIIITDSTGQLKQVLNKSMGLMDELAYGVCEDNQQGLWLALNDGIARINYPSPFTWLGEESGLGRTINQITRYQGELFFAGQSGVYQLNPSNNLKTPPEISFSHSQAQSNALLKLDDKLLVGSSSGVSQIEGNSIKEITDMGVGELYRSPFNPNVILLPNNEGLRLYIFTEGKWQMTGWVKGLSSLYQSILEESPGSFWLADYSGIARLKLDIDGIIRTKGLPEIIPDELKIFKAEENGLPPYWKGVFRIEGRTVFGMYNGLKQFDQENQTFVPDTTFGAHLADSSINIYRLIQHEPGNFWVLCNIQRGEVEHLERVSRNSDGQYSSESMIYKPLLDLENNRPIYKDEQNPDVIWFGGINGVARYDTRIKKKINLNISPLIRKVYTQDTVILFGGAIDSNGKKTHLSRDYSTSSIRFEYALPFFENAEKTIYQYKLEGFDDHWSAWTSKTEKEYGNLPEGNYGFVVRAKNFYGITSKDVRMDLTIFPPWYRTWWAFSLLGILAFFFIAAIVYLYNSWKMQQLIAQNQKLEETVDERTKEIHSKNLQLAESLNNLQKTQQQLIVQEKMASLGQLTVGIAHEIKNPLNFINNFSRTSVEMAGELKEEIEERVKNLSEEDQEVIFELIEDIQEQISIVNEHGVRTDEIVNGMMNHASDNHGEKRNTDLNKLIEEQLNLALVGYHANKPELKIEIQKDSEKNLPMIPLNPQEIGRVLINLFNNAFFAMEQRVEKDEVSYKPVLKIQSKMENDKISVVVRDNGLGISSEIIDQIFQPFFTTKTTGQGNIGLGLSISYDIITKGHQGELKVKSEKEKFTEFVIELPKNN